MHNPHNQKVITTKKNSGFTLIELLVVISIIGILSSIVLASLNGAKQSARNAVTQSEVRQFQTQLALFFLENGGYPAPWAIAGNRYAYWYCLGLNCLNSAAASKFKTSVINGDPTGTIVLWQLNDLITEVTPNTNSLSTLFGSGRAEAAAVGFSQFNSVAMEYPIFYYCSNPTLINGKTLCPEGSSSDSGNGNSPWVITPTFSGNTVTYTATKAGGTQTGTINSNNNGYGY